VLNHNQIIENEKGIELHMSQVQKPHNG